MQRNVYLITLFLLSISGCAAFNGFSESEVQTVEEQAPPPPAAEKSPAPVVADSPTENDQAAAPLKKPPSKEEIRRIQVRLKTAGFDPGPIDGILGPKTRSVLLRMQAGCRIVNDLVGTSDAAISGLVAETQAPELTNPANTSLREEQIRHIQERLKLGGFDPGPIDGILGAKTRSAISRCKSGCTALEDLLRSSDKRVLEPTPALQSAPASAYEKPTQPVVYHAPPPRQPVKNEAGKTTAALNHVSSEQEIRLAQERLKAAGLDPGRIDGVLGPKTKSALEKYRSSY